MLGGEPDRDVAAPGLADHNRFAQIEDGQQDGQVGRGGGRLVPGGRRVGLAVAAQVNGIRRVAGGGEPLAHAVPQPGVRGQPVHQQERGRSVTRTVQHVQSHPVGDAHRQFGHPHAPDPNRRPARR
jgi:hypothetical protein